MESPQRQWTRCVCVWCWCTTWRLQYVDCDDYPLNWPLKTFVKLTVL